MVDVFLMYNRGNMPLRRLDKKGCKEYSNNSEIKVRKRGRSVKNNPVFKALLYVASGCLILFYLYVIYLGFHPQVSDEYRAYYIDHTISQWPY